MTALHSRAWQPEPAEVEHSDRLDQKVQMLSTLITAAHLDIPPCYRHEGAWDVARKELRRMDAYKAPRDKLVCARDPAAWAVRTLRLCV
jgi:hypothetical protein